MFLIINFLIIVVSSNEMQWNSSRSIKSPLGRVLYCYFNMPTINKTYLILS